MGIVNSLRNCLPLLQAVGSNPGMLRLHPSVLRFFGDYMGKFRIRDVGGHHFVHSHLPPLNSPAYSRFVNEHLLAGIPGPSHAQIGITDACPQHCEYCYNRNRKGTVMDKQTILQAVRELRHMGVVWLGLTGGEPLLNKDIAEIVESASSDCAVKLFTTGCTLTPEKAVQLNRAGLSSVSISLDHWSEQVHDRGRGYQGAFRQALAAIDIFLNTGGIHVGVSSVLSREMIQNGQVEQFLDFVERLGVHEAWLSGVKPSLAAFWSDELIVAEEHRLRLVRLQDHRNAGSGMTVNYLGHFEGKECFGCNAGNKMVYVDAFGEVSPCVFTPLSFGNVRSQPLTSIVTEMREHFPSEDSCFINKNYRLLQQYSAGESTVGRNETLELLQQVRFGPPARFNQLFRAATLRRAATSNQGPPAG